MPNNVREACYQYFLSKNAGKIGVNTAEEMQRYIAAGMTNVVMVKGGMYCALQATPEYKNNVKVVPRKTPQTLLDEWNDKFGAQLVTGNDEMLELIKLSANWRG